MPRQSPFRPRPRPSPTNPHPYTYQHSLEPPSHPRSLAASTSHHTSQPARSPSHTRRTSSTLHCIHARSHKRYQRPNRPGHTHPTQHCNSLPRRRQRRPRGRRWRWPLGTSPHSPPSQPYLLGQWGLLPPRSQHPLTH